MATACFLARFWHAVPPSDLGFFAAIQCLFLAHIAWRWRRPASYAAWRSLSTAAWLWLMLLPAACHRGYGSMTVANLAPLLEPGVAPLWLQAGAAAALLAFSSMAFPLFFFGMARPTPLLLHIPAQSVVLASTLLRNRGVCALAMQRRQAAGAIRGAYLACAAVAAMVQELALVVVGQTPEVPQGRRAQPLRRPDGDLAMCGTLFAFLQLVIGFAGLILLLAQQEARLYDSAALPDPPPGRPPCRGWWQHTEALQRRLALRLAAVPTTVHSSLAAQLLALYSLALLWAALANLHGVG